MKVAIITDTHWGARNDSTILIEYYNKFYTNVFIPKLIEEKIDTVLMLGDTFDRRKYTNHVSLAKAKEIYFDPLQKLGINIHMLVGNHDTAYKNTNDVNSPDLLLREFDNIEVIDTPRTIQVGGIDICMLPWICSDNHMESMNEIRETKAEICMGHLEISGFEMYRGSEAHDGMDQKILSKFDMVFSGHFHHKSDNGHIYYLGNPYELTWQDYNDPRGFHIFDLASRSLSFIRNPYTLFCRLEYDDTKELEDPSDLVKDKYVKIIVVNKNDYYGYDQYLSKVYNGNPIDVKIVEDFSEFTEGKVDESIDLEDTADVMTQYIESLDTDVDKEKIKTFMKSLYIEALNKEVV